jgi:hypothetical protein
MSQTVALTLSTRPRLVRSNDRKVTNLVSPNGKTPKIANAFGLPAGKDFSCPGQTATCGKICYAGKLEKIYKGVRSVLTANFEALRNAGGIDGMTELLAAMISEFNAECEHKNAEKKFRIHWDGDFFSRDYAQAWANVVRAFPEITFWVYTRSFGAINVLDIITDIPNLTVYLSADKDNIALANERAAEFPGVFIATLADTFAEARETIIDSTRKVYNCPENKKSIPLISEKGSACVRCGICIAGRGDVTFAAKKK